MTETVVIHFTWFRCMSWRVIGRVLLGQRCMDRCILLVVMRLYKQLFGSYGLVTSTTFYVTEILQTTVRSDGVGQDLEFQVIGRSFTLLVRGKPSLMKT